MQKTRIALSLLIGMIALSLTATTVQAGTATVASVWTEDGSGNKLNLFNVGQTVYIYWNVAPSDGTIDLYIIGQTGLTVATIGTFGPGAQPQTWTPTSTGYYYVVAKGAVEYVFPIAVASIFIMPESALGTLMATAAGFAAFGTITIVKQKHAKKQKP